MAVSPGGILFFLYLIVILVLVCLNGLLAGLTLGLLSLDETKLQVLVNSGTIEQKIAATKVAPIRKNTHFLLATLLLGSTIINETLPILLQSIVNNEFICIIISVLLVLTFAELIPQAVSTHYGLQMGAMFTWFVYTLEVIMFPVSWPLGKALDWLLGEHEGALYKKTELKEFVTLHGTTHGGDLSSDEVKMLQGVLLLHKKVVSEVMTKLKHVFMLEAGTLLSSEVIQSIADSGHSRIPIYVEQEGDTVVVDENGVTTVTIEKDIEIVGIMLVKNLILLDDRVPTLVRELDLIKAPTMKTDMNLFDALNYFQEGASHLAIVKDGENTTGIVTLEDIIEELLMEEVVDESDLWVDNEHTARVIRKAKSMKSNIIALSKVK
jgi:metal transporter CNNM